MIEQLADDCVLALNALHGGAAIGFSPRRATRVQREALEAICRKTARMVGRLRATGAVGTDAEALSELLKSPPEGGVAPAGRGGRLDASRIDHLPAAGQVDPADTLGAAYKELFSDTATVFPEGRDDLRHFGEADALDRTEYVKVTVAQLRSGKLELAHEVQGGGKTFCVPKDSGALREVWNGTRVSAAAAPPPRPPHLADPEAFAAVSIPSSRRLLVSKRDCRALFDQLAAPPGMRSFFGRPAVSVSELEKAGLTRGELRRCCVDAGPLLTATRLFPRSRVWPMGFSYSSWVAQSTMLEEVRSAGFGDEGLLATDIPTPLGLPEMHALATDDFIHLSTQSEQSVRARMQRYDRVMEGRGIALNDGKSVTAASSAMVIGLLVDEGRFLAPSPARHLRLLRSVVELASGPNARELSPYELLAVPGTYNWLARLNRPLFGAIGEAYAFGHGGDPRRRRSLPPAAVRDLVLGVALLPLAEVDFCMPWHPGIVATDASSVFGFGVAVARASAASVAALGRHSLTKETVAELLADPAEAPIERKPRRGVRVDVPVSRSRFRVTLSARAQFQAHSGGLELHGAQLALEQFLRDPRHLGHRLVMLMDAKAPMYGIVKGRSNAVTLARGTQRVDALLLAGGTRLHLFYIPSEVNPGDPPSRGLRLHPEGGRRAAGAGQGRAAAARPPLEPGAGERIAELAAELRAILA